MTDTTTIPLSITKWPPRLRVWNTVAGVVTSALWEIHCTPPWVFAADTAMLHNQVWISEHLHGNSQDKPWLFDLHLFDKFPGLVGTGLEVRLNVEGTVKWWWKGKECFVYPLQSLTLKLNVPIKFITTTLLSLCSTPRQREQKKGKVLFIWNLVLIY